MTVQYPPRGSSSPPPGILQTLSIGPGGTWQDMDAIGTLFGLTGYSALRITANVEVLAICRMYNQPAGAALKDTTGQDYAAIPASFAIGSDQATQVLRGFEPGTPDPDFRNGFGYVEVSGNTANVRVTVLGPFGTPLGSWNDPTPVQPFENRYYGSASDFPTKFPGTTGTNLRLQFEVTGGTGKIIAVGSLVANGSNDGTTFEMSFADSLLGGAGGLSLVTHDATLIGDGTTASALGIADGGVSKAKLKATGGTTGQVLGTDGANLVWQAAGGALTLPYFGVGSTPDTSATFAITNTGGGKGDGVDVVSYSGHGIWGRAIDAGHAGVVGTNDHNGNDGNLAGAAAGAFGESTNVYGVYGRSTSGEGVRGESGSSYGVHGVSTTGDGVFGQSSAASKSGVYAVNTNTAGHAGYFNGNVQINGTLSATGTKSFVIDHPLDPENKFLYHAAIESSGVLNVYSGNVTTDERGLAIVPLPDWFEAVNRDFRYQLTCIGRFAQAIVEQEVEHNRFTIRTNLAKVRVSWQVTGVRNDPGIRLHPFAAERDKPEAERGTYLQPEAYGQPEEKGVEWARHPELMKKSRAEGGTAAERR